MSTAARSKAIVGYNVQAAVDTEHHLIVAHEVTNVGHDRSQLANMALHAKEAIGADNLTVLADRGYFNGAEILACEGAGITAYVPKTQTSNNQAKGLFGRGDFVYQPEDDEYECPAGERLIYRFTDDSKDKAILEAMEDRVDRLSSCLRIRGSTVEHPFGTIRS